MIDVWPFSDYSTKNMKCRRKKTLKKRTEKVREMDERAKLRRAKRVSICSERLKGSVWRGDRMSYSVLFLIFFQEEMLGVFDHSVPTGILLSSLECNIIDRSFSSCFLLLLTIFKPVFHLIFFTDSISRKKVTVDWTRRCRTVMNSQV